MDRDDLHLIGPDEIAFRLDLTPAQLRVTHTALKAMGDGFGHDERDVHDIIREVLAKLPAEGDLPDLAAEIAKRRPAA